MQEPVVLLLAAGLGTRLQPLTNYLPKCLVPVQGYPLIFYWLKQIKELGIRDCYINLHYHGDLVRKVIESSPYKGWVNYIEEDALLGTAGTVRAVFPKIEGRSVWLIHADNLSAANWSDFLDTYDSACGPGDMLMHTFITDHPQSCGIVKLDEQKRVTEFHEKVKHPPSNLANGAVYLLSPDVVKRIAEDESIKDFSTQLVPDLIGKIVAWQTDGYHRDIGRWPAYIAAQQEFSVPWQPAQSDEWLQLWQDETLLSGWIAALEESVRIDDIDEGLSQSECWEVIATWPSPEKFDDVIYAAAVSYPIDCSPNEINEIVRHNIILSRC